MTFPRHRSPSLLSPFLAAGRCLVAAGTMVVALACATSALPRAVPSPDCRTAAGGAQLGAPPPVRWSSAAQDSALQDLWCSGVGPAATRRGQPPAFASAVDSVAIVTWNLHAGAGDLAALVADLRAGRLTGGEPVSAFVLLLQEAYRAGPAVPERAAGAASPDRVAPGGESRHAGIDRLAGELDLALVYVPSMRNGRSADGVAEDRGNAILSNLPLARPTAIELPFEAQRRVAVSATIGGAAASGRRWELLVSSVHLDTRSTGVRFLDTFGAGRLRQAQGLVEELPDSMPAVVGGDLNTWSLAALESSLPFLRERFPDTPCPLREATFDNGWGFRRRLDHVFLRLPAGWSGRYARVDDRYGSDHYPLLAWVRMTGGGAAERAAPRCSV